MPAPGGDSVRELIAAVKSGKIEGSDVDARVNELLELISSTGKAVKEATKNAVLKDGELNLPDDIKKKHHDLAYKAAAESMTLLKNNNGILPLKRNTKVAIIGDFAKIQDIGEQAQVW